MNLIKLVLFNALRVTIGVLSGLTLVWFFTVFLRKTNSDARGFTAFMVSALTTRPSLWVIGWLLAVGIRTRMDIANRPKKPDWTRGELTD